MPKKPWEVDPIERGLRGSPDVEDFLRERDLCQLCPRLGQSAYLCAAEIRLLNPAARAKSMSDCRESIATGNIMPRYGLRKST